MSLPQCVQVENGPKLFDIKPKKPVSRIALLPPGIQLPKLDLDADDAAPLDAEDIYAGINPHDGRNDNLYWNLT